MTPAPSVCTLPLAGWSCTRNAGHKGPCAAVRTDEYAGWTSPSLARAYFEIEAEQWRQNQHPENPISEALRFALGAIEAADCELGKYA